MDDVLHQAIRTRTALGVMLGGQHATFFPCVLSSPAERRVFGYLRRGRSHRLASKCLRMDDIGDAQLVDVAWPALPDFSRQACVKDVRAVVNLAGDTGVELKPAPMVPQQTPLPWTPFSDTWRSRPQSPRWVKARNEYGPKPEIVVTYQRE